MYLQTGHFRILYHRLSTICILLLWKNCIQIHFQVYLIILNIYAYPTMKVIVLVQIVLDLITIHDFNVKAIMFVSI